MSAKHNMKYFKVLTSAFAAVVVVACDNSNTGLIVSGENGDGIETIDFFGMESPDSETIAYEPELGFALPARGALSVRTGVIGSSANGTDYRRDCGVDQVLVGIEGFASGNRINQVGAVCVESNATGGWVGSPLLQPDTVGISSGNPFSRVCQSGQAMTGITGLTRNDAVGSMQIHCTDLVNATRTDGAEQTSAIVGENSTSTGSQLCGTGAVATGIQGRANNDLKALGLVCNESPGTAGRWSNPLNWPLMAVHAVLTPQGDVFSYGFRQGAGSIFDYDVWSPGSTASATGSHNTLTNDLKVFSFCNASVVLPGSGNILMPGGTLMGSDNGGVSDVPVYDTTTGALSRAPDMANRRWYPTTVTLPSGEILVAGGRDIAGVPTNTPEIYTPESNEWRSLFGANMLGLDWAYPRLWVANDGRVFGINRNQMYFINTQGSGSIQKAGEFPAAYRTGSEATAVMYRPGKILQLGGNVSGGTSALIIDINGDTPQARATGKMRLSRSAWVNSQILADGKVMAIGGSRLVNEATTAALNSEIWDPETEEWTVVSGFKWPRLYHSTSVLLKDATVLISGGGNPGPVKNFNSEIFSPPYLFNDDGTPAVRPEITWAPTQGAYGQEIALNTDGTAIAKVAFIKTSSVTHSFNVEQRYMELPFSTAPNGLKLQLPADPAIATPGHYLVFTINEQGTPSQGEIIKLGNEPAQAPPEPVVIPEPVDTGVTNLLVNGGFEQDRTNWLDCSDAALSSVSANAHSGEKALTQQSGACLFQEFAVEPGMTYTVSCDAYAQNSAYSSVSLNMLDAAYAELAADTKVVSAAAYTTHSTSLTAPATAAFSAVTLYSEGPTHFDSCVVTSSDQPVVTPVEPVAPVTTPEPTDPQPPGASLLVNGDFEQDKEQWLDCASDQLTQVIGDNTGKAMQVSNAGCIYQEFPITVGKQYKMQCVAKSEGSQYSSITFQMADATYNQLESNVSVVGPGQYQTYTATLTAPAGSANSAVTLYSEDVSQIDLYR